MLLEKHRSQGEAMHYTYLSMQEGDARRHKTWCVYYKKGVCLCKDNACCVGSAFCQQYKENQKGDDKCEQEAVKSVCKEDLNNKIYQIFVGAKNLKK